MQKIIIISHGSYSSGILESVQMLIGSQENLVAYGLYPEDSTLALTKKIEYEIKEIGAENILFFTDLFHGSPFNIVVSLTEHYDLYHITGVNIPLLLEAIMARNEGKTTAEICKKIMDFAPSTIKDVGEMLNLDNE